MRDSQDGDRPPIGPLTRRLVYWCAGRDDEELDAEQRRSAYGLVEGYASVGLNLALFGLKLALGLVTGSIALIADAIHTASDSLTSVVVLIASYIARRPPDEEHPFGHGRSEAVGAVVIAVLLGVTALELGKESVARILEPRPISAPWVIIGLVLGTVLAKEWMSRWALRLGQRSGNRSVLADAWHHRSDALSTLLVVAAMVGARFGVAWLDGVMGLAVSLLIAKVAFDVARDAVSPLLGEAPDLHEVEAVKRQAMEVDGVRGVHNVVIHYYGSRTFISLHIETTDDHSPMELHQISHRVEHKVARSGHGSVCVHVDPLNADHPAYEAVESRLMDLVEADDDLLAFHDLRIVGDAEEFTILCDLQPRSGFQEHQGVVRRIERGLCARFPGADCVIEVDPEFSY